MAAADAAFSRTLSLFPEAHVYKLPPRPSAGGYRCQEWGKGSHIFTGRVRVTALGDDCIIALEDKDTGSLFAQCPLSNENPELSVEPVSDSSRYFVLRVQDGEGRHAFLGMGFVERNDAFEFNVTLQDHVKHIKWEAEHAKGLAAEAAAPAAPPTDFSLKGTMSIALPAGRTPKPRDLDKVAATPSSIGGLMLAPPPPAGAQSRRRVPAPAVMPPAELSASTTAAQPDADSSGGGSGWATFG
uniref:NECAP PHear domain-containing protein n=1 Tax=Coccolithus braarudii TaxID=221442 RepID=A0A7S0Q1S2_9EUKA|mmetsp:Transcript_24825/g.53565  ORF Transcript_24825/g.53565 Transcript_24825/m.53565 type:complete len:242 (+) Transcript_24825:50-775(+)|eukprot:CAMPEP_0183355586 /NCGR_PEP_ID=MMETSP0164_2-20130417/40974_1 /TAXON_ID=221442 /ORGANISM="Coccolithus pelagicus ssp braarudi, Strain PLY182g" /LENGTH=241 /DNA_ID=CAMNT_0025528735 /DNA_START=50 /DNA_END=775 /DNA_ORIENTATION=-